MNAGKSIFITATDTGVGKTLVCGLLLRFLLGRRLKAGYQKWVSTGDSGSPADLQSCRQVANLPDDFAPLDLQVPYRFVFPASPHLAAALESRKIDPEKIITAHQAMSCLYDLLVVEGVGGLLVPLSRDQLLADLLSRLQLPTIIVSRSGLGTLNHTLLTLEAMRSRKIPILGVVFTDSENENETVVEDNIKTIGETGGVDVLGRLPYCPEPQSLFPFFTPIGEKILAQLNQPSQ